MQEPEDAGGAAGGGSGGGGSGGGGRVGVRGGGERAPACAQDRAAPAPPLSGSIVVRLLAFDFVSLEVPEDLTAKVCPAGDLGCTNSLVVGVRPQADGMLEFDLPVGFDGYFELESPSTVTMWVFSNRPLQTSTVLPSVVMLTPETLLTIAQSGGEPEMDSTRGLVLIDVRDCDGAAAPGVSLEHEAVRGASAFYFQGTFPDRQLSATVFNDNLDPSGAERALGGFSDTEQGYATFVGKKDGTEFGRVTATVLPPALSYVFLYQGH